ncbi:putative motility protein [Clostridium sp. MD294]|uniref:putative motility protein n=1 Tax=Clostridium sp. MD294 TaxID=97138 RepID=UPI0002CABA36|nr:putative motility protein [Clostridium sp. MD294]NDO47570.1 putative motility protein [Clostridium sp. MD294]USF29356.1 hypothetical protein C820_000746 [Clostridium sp. MD294]
MDVGGLGLAGVQMQAGIALTKNCMESAELQAAQLIESMEAANPVNLPSSHMVDMLV